MICLTEILSKFCLPCLITPLTKLQYGTAMHAYRMSSKETGFANVNLVVVET